MTIDTNIKRSQSMWVINRRPSPLSSLASTPMPSRSNSVIDVSTNKERQTQISFIRRFRKARGRKSRKYDRTSLTSPGLTLGPCLCGDIDAVDSQGRSLLFYAARYGQADTAQQLLDAGCAVNLTDRTGSSPLHEAVERGHLHVAEIFLKSGM